MPWGCRWKGREESIASCTHEVAFPFLTAHPQAKIFHNEMSGRLIIPPISRHASCTCAARTRVQLDKCVGALTFYPAKSLQPDIGPAVFSSPGAPAAKKLPLHFDNIWATFLSPSFSIGSAARSDQPYARVGSGLARPQLSGAAPCPATVLRSTGRLLLDTRGTRGGELVFSRDTCASRPAGAAERSALRPSQECTGQPAISSPIPLSRRGSKIHGPAPAGHWGRPGARGPSFPKIHCVLWPAGWWIPLHHGAHAQDRHAAPATCAFLTGIGVLIYTRCGVPGILSVLIFHFWENAAGERGQLLHRMKI